MDTYGATLSHETLVHKLKDALDCVRSGRILPPTCMTFDVELTLALLDVAHAARLGRPTQQLVIRACEQFASWAIDACVRDQSLETPRHRRARGRRGTPKLPGAIGVSSIEPSVIEPSVIEPSVIEPRVNAWLAEVDAAREYSRQFDRGARRCGNALRFAVRPQHGVTVFSAQGQLDAANTAHLADVVIQFLRFRDGLVIDLGALQFCSVAGLEFLMYFDRRCRGAHCPWVLIPGPSLARLLPLFGAFLPVAGSLQDAADLLEAARAHRPTLRIAT